MPAKKKKKLTPRPQEGHFERKMRHIGPKAPGEHSLVRRARGRKSVLFRNGTIKLELKKRYFLNRILHLIAFILFPSKLLWLICWLCEFSLVNERLPSA